MQWRRGKAGRDSGRARAGHEALSGKGEESPRGRLRQHSAGWPPASDDEGRNAANSSGTFAGPPTYYLATAPDRPVTGPTVTTRRAPRGRATARRSPMTKIQESGERVVSNVERVIVGKHNEVRLALVALLCRGHLLIEDVPGTGKTVLA